MSIESLGKRTERITQHGVSRAALVTFTIRTARERMRTIRGQPQLPPLFEQPPPLPPTATHAERETWQTIADMRARVRRFRKVSA
jgi:hypothetical protein